MPRYKKDVHLRVEDSDVEEMLRRCLNARHGCLIALLYRTGARPIELSLLKSDDIRVSEELLVVTLWTAKNGLPRDLSMSRRLRFVDDVIIPYVEAVPKGGRLFDMTESTIKQVVYKASQNRLTPYTFRHNRLTRLAQAGATPYQLMIWKGAKDMKSISQYLYRSPMVMKDLQDAD